ncbi:unnamed protein product [Adineta steineri]|uniref:Uncharacterized protein n=1 Tax=Adineta steineri TaxID=433720 RepID=A0A813UIU0_9BILA|nr:unnamed protein product [Adineta steineri]CAF0828279.1 unnamed protein product [Adineta steineri]CAF0868348.1 unnamed protein product [Adineta steineri]CAF0983984.1 unnamed protein product [Adineta steineri]CAF1052368.1 unnamed protein product [Adineta steineri]
MGAATSSNTKRYSDKFNSNIYSTPPKSNNGGKLNRVVQLQCDPRSPTDGISRTPIQIDSQLPIAPLKLYNHVIPHIVGPDLILPEVIDDSNQENEIRHRQQKLDIVGHDTKRSSGIEPSLDPTKVLTTLMANHNGQLPPYQL